jgi:hypothetical protein
VEVLVLPGYGVAEFGSEEAHAPQDVTTMATKTSLTVAIFEQSRSLPSEPNAPNEPRASVTPCHAPLGASAQFGCWAASVLFGAPLRRRNRAALL